MTDTTDIAPPPRPEQAISREHDASVLSEALAAIAGLNEQVLAALTDSARNGEVEFPLAPALRGSIAALTQPQWRRAAQCRVLLVDAGFSDLKRWVDGTLAGESMVPPEDRRPWLPAGQSEVLSYAVLMVAWHIVHRSRAVAALLLGMPDAVLTVFEKLSVSDLSLIARTHAGWVQPRWRQRSEMWVSVVGSVTQAGASDMAAMIFRFLQASATDATQLIASVEPDT
jgi:hypothetical protein